MVYKIGDINMQIDQDATQEYYVHAQQLQCNCSVCRNYREWYSLYGKSDLHLLSTFGIDLEKLLGIETYQDTLVDEMIECDCYALLVGKIDEPAHRMPAYSGFGDGIDMSVSSMYTDYLNALENRPPSSFELRFRIKIPWCLDEQFG